MSAKRLCGVAALLFVAVASAALQPQSTPTPKTLEEEAANSCLWKRSSTRELVERSQKTGFSTDAIEALEFAMCMGKETAVLEEEVRRGYRAPFVPKKTQQQTQQTGEMACPPSYWLTVDGCQKAITAGH